MSINGTKIGFHVQKCPYGTIGANISYVLGLLVHGKVVVECCRKVSIIKKTLNMAKQT